ncbi:MAG: iron chelate uptake ABC transporter family permease subunit [Clostridiales bacterium]|jgi:iron complex transport system permease protein|nr:iron chelate uptake ABC transporter family permease subunit [Clostridiales bacterium]
MIYMHKKKYYRKVYIALLITLFVVVLFSCSVGAADLSMVDAFKIIIQKLPFVGQILIEEPITNTMVSIIWRIRMPRILLAGIVGAALAFSGTIYQGLFKNPMAESFVLGVSAGAALGGAIGMILGISRVMGIGGTGLMAFTGALLTTYLVYQLGRTGGRVSMTSLLLAGMAINFMLSAAISLLMIFNRQRMDNIIMWTMGSFANSTWGKVVLAFITVIAGMLVTRFFARDLNVLLMGEEEAKHLGIDVERTKKILLALSSFIAAMAVAVSGIIGFVGLIVPHAIRLVMGPDHRVLLPYSAVVGSIFLIIADTMARTLVSPLEIPVGIITALAGAPFFLYLLSRKKREM